jgi:TATA-binding protein-associated factor Taf7
MVLVEEEEEEEEEEVEEEENEEAEEGEEDDDDDENGRDTSCNSDGGAGLDDRVGASAATVAEHIVSMTSEAFLNPLSAQSRRFAHLSMYFRRGEPGPKCERSKTESCV